MIKWQRQELESRGFKIPTEDEFNKYFLRFSAMKLKKKTESAKRLARLKQIYLWVIFGLYR